MRRLCGICVVVIAEFASLATSACAQEQQAATAKQVAGLFMQSCVQFAGDKKGLREWAKKNSLRELPTDVQEYFLYGLPGVVFDASTKAGKFVLVSEDGGSCSVIAEMASGPAVIGSLEEDLNEARITFKVTAEKGDTEEKALKHREYLASQGQREWLLLVSTVKDPSGGQAMLTANRY